MRYSKVLLIFAALLLAAHAIVFLGFTIDDAYITFTIAKNLAAGNGPVFVRGEAVEATSSMLWAVLLAPFELFVAGDGAVIGSKILGLIAMFGVFVTGTLLLRSLIEESGRLSSARAVFGLLLALSSPFVVWSVYGLEHGLVALLLLLAVTTFLTELREGRGCFSAFWIFLMQTVRPEGFIFLVVFVVARFGYRLLEGERGFTVRDRGWYLLLFVPLAGYEAAGLWYYGDLLPNTVYAKMRSLSLSRPLSGLRYALYPASWIFLLLYLFSVPLLFLRVCFSRGLAFRVRLARHFAALLIASLLTMQAMFILVTGGDWMPNARFFSHVIPLLLLLFVLLIFNAYAALERAGFVLPLRGALRIMGAGGALLFTALSIHTAIDTYGGQSILRAAEERSLDGMAALLNRIAPDDRAVVACGDVGRVGYYFKGSVLDWWGLANREIARRGQSFGRVAPEVVYNRKPEYLVLYSNDSVLTQASMHSDMARSSRVFYHHAEFANYRQVKSFLFWDGRWHVLFERVKH